MGYFIIKKALVVIWYKFITCYLLDLTNQCYILLLHVYFIICNTFPLLDKASLTASKLM